MTLGQKIKEARLKRGLTQQKLCANELTRNMLSAIECDKATPSLSTLEYIAKGLGLSCAYLISDESDPFLFEKNEKINKIRELYSAKKYGDCISLLSTLSGGDDETYYLLAECHFALGRRAVLGGALITAKEHLEKAEEYTKKTAYNTSGISHLLIMYNALANNIQSPLLEFDVEEFEAGIDPNYEFEFYRYILADHDYPYKNPTFKKHAIAKEYIKSRRYSEALRVLEEIIGEKNPESYNSHLMFGVYTDMEYCSKQLGLFEAAYKYASKRLSMIEGFKA